MRRERYIVDGLLTGLMRSVGILLLSAVTVLTVMSCGGSDDTVSPDLPKGDRPIAFSGSLSESQSETHARTRVSATPLSATHQTFYVWAYKNKNSDIESVMQKYINR